MVQALPARVRVMALTSSPERSAELRARGITPLRGNLDDPLSLQRLAGLAHRVLHLAPPPGEGWQDPRTLALTRALRRRIPLRRGRGRALCVRRREPGSGIASRCASVTPAACACVA